MGKIVIDKNFLGTENFINVSLEHAKYFSEKRNYKSKKFEMFVKNLDAAKTVGEFKETFEKEFGEDIKIKI
ncbi:MAG: hypothetical protein ACOC1K_03250 [Nanoarchaeota archaeon]